ncbi:cytochrome P450 [Streptomyces sp. ML-6]|uniref:cytochrome P450 n=1 Tax=Streptomyces sp. ML-6 TaxID=2982693 RepID=UPI0024C0C5AC|nr:cytochrome P450 [Streptomyces sp. ML-6]MDK0517667.1 cytochrome P450 [Streptomyces sp. ML-6]
MPLARTVPLHRVEAPVPGPPRLIELPNGTPVWLVTRYDDVHQVLTDPRFGRSPVHAPDAPPVVDGPSLLDSRDSMGRQDGDAHLRLRRAVGRAFTPRAVEHMRPWVAGVVDQLLDGFVEQGPPADLVTDYALPLPCMVIHRLLAVDDVPTERLLRWAEHAFAGATAAPEEGECARRELADFATALITARRSKPGDDLVSSVVRATGREGGIPEAMLVNLISTMIVGGHDTTMTMLSNSLLYLLTEQPGAWARLGADEQAAEALTERLLHLIPLGDREERPGHVLAATADILLSGVMIRTGDLVTTDHVAANRDPAAFPGNPHDDLFAPLPKPSLAFGAGRHYCLGTWLARAELQLALHRLADRLPALRLTITADDIRWRHGTVTRSPLHLPAAW